MMTEDQKVVSMGLYSHIRHPGYLGEIFLWSGFGILSSILIAAVVLPVMFIAVLLYRISSEEKMLAQELGDRLKFSTSIEQTNLSRMSSEQFILQKKAWKVTGLI